MDLNNLQQKIISNAHKHLLMICVFLFAAYIFAQFIILSGIGTKGADISETRARQEQLRLENEVLQAEIDGARTSERLESQIELLGLGYTEVSRIVIDYSPANLVGFAE